MGATGREMRPRSILLFERLFLFSLVLGGVQAAAGWEELGRRAAAGEGEGAMLALLALTFGTLTGLALLVSRGRMRSAKWLLVILCFLGLPLFFARLTGGTIVGWELLAVVQAALQVTSLALLFTKEARGWLAASETG